MSIAGSTRSGGTGAPYDAALPVPDEHAPVSAAPPRRRRRIVRWEGLIPLVLLLVLAVAGWMTFGDWLARRWLQDAATQALGTQVDVASVVIQERRAAIELRGLAIADPRDRTRNLFEAAVLRLELEPEPLLEKKVVVRRLAVREARGGTRRAVPARPARANGYVATTLRGFDAWAAQFDRPLLSLTPIDTIKAIVLDPTQLQTVQAALRLAQRTDSTQRALREGYDALRLRETLDSARAVVERLRGVDPKALGITGVQAAVADVRRAAARVDSARRRVETLARGARAGVDTLQAGVRSLDDARRADYAFAKSLLRLPSFEAPAVGQAFFGAVSIAEFQKALYWATLAREYVPPGLLPREDPGPKRVRMAGRTVRFVEPRRNPRFHLRRADMNLQIVDGRARGTYALAVSDLTTDAAVVGRPTLFALRRTAGGSDIEQLRVTGTMDHRGLPRDVVSATASGVKLPGFALPLLPYRAEPGRGTSELRMVLEGQHVQARWAVRSGEVAWPVTDAARAGRLNYMESLLARVITGIGELSLEAELEGPVSKPELRVRSNLDRLLADRLKSVAGEELARAEAKVRARVDEIVEEKSAPVRARVTELRDDAQQRIDEARTRLEQERATLDERLKALTAGAVKLPGLPDVPALPGIPRIPSVRRDTGTATPAPAPAADSSAPPPSRS